jgi:ribonucleotide reductase alpha subunit
VEACHEEYVWTPVFVTSEPPHGLVGSYREITPEDHLRMQVAFQKHVDNAVSKTINLPQTATPEDIATIYRQA